MLGVLQGQLEILSRERERERERGTVDLETHFSHIRPDTPFFAILFRLWKSL